MFKKKGISILGAAGLFITSTALLGTSDAVIPVAIIGSGCAGLSAASVIGEYGYNPVVFAGPVKGGDLNVKTEVGNWYGIHFSYGNKIMSDVLFKTEKLGAQIIHTSIESVDFSKRPFKLTDLSGKVHQAHTVIIATGTKDRNLTISGADENRDKILNNWDVHKDLKGYKKRAKRKSVAIIGGGIDAMKKAFYAARAGAHEIHVFVRSTKMKLPPWREKFLKRKPGTIKVTYGREVTKVERLNENKVRLHFKSGETYDAGLVVASIGRVPRSEIFTSQVKTNEKGFIVINAKTQETSVPGIYACGDVTDASGPDAQALIALGNGMIAGYTVVEELIKDQP